MKEIFANLLKEFQKFNTYQKVAAAVLALSIPLCLGMGISSVSSGSSSEDSGSLSLPSSSIVESSTPRSSSQETSSASKRNKKIHLIPASVEEDLEVQIVDENDEIVLNEKFVLHVKCAANGYSKYWTVDGDGFLRLPTIPSGVYTVSIEEIDGYDVPSEPVTVKVEKKVDYEKIDVSDKVVDESKVDVSKEDAAYDDAQVTPATPAPLKDTVKYVKSSSKEKDEKYTRITYKYKPTLTDSGVVKTKDGKESNIMVEVDKDGYVTKAWELSYPREEQAVALEEHSILPAAMALSLMDNTTVIQMENSGIAPIDEDDSDASTPAPTTEVPQPVTPPPTPVPTPEPTVEPTPEITPEPTPEPTPATTPDPTPEITPTPEPTPEQTPETTPTRQPSPSPAEPSPSPSVAPSPSPVQPSPSVKPSESPAVSPSPSAKPSPSPSVAPSPSPSVKPSPSPVKKEITLFAEDGKVLEAYSNLMLAEKKIETEATRKVTVYYGWQTLEGKKYYFNKDGEKVTGTQVIQGVTYFFDKNGVMGNRVGIDVSKYQRDIDWKKVKETGVEFAIIRVGYRGYGSGALVEDSYFAKNIKNATKAGLKVGVYIFSQAINTKEAVEEASMCIDAVKGYKLAYPIFFDTEYSTSRKTGRADHLTKSQRTKIAKAFCETVENAGYQAGIYASASWFTGQLNYSDISKYDIWVAHYGVDKPKFDHHYDIWQYTGSGTCAGVPGAVDMNIGYTYY